MKVLFVRPRYDSGFGMKPIGIAILSAIAKRVGFQTDLFDTGYIEHEFESYDYLEKLQSVGVVKPADFKGYNFIRMKISLEQAVIQAIKKSKPNLMAISVISGQHILAEKISRYAKKYDPQITIIWGGPYVTVCPEEALQQGADYVCIGEGLVAFNNFLKTFVSNGNLSQLNNIWSKCDNKIIRNKLAPIKETLEDLPYLDWSIFDERDFLKPYDGKVLRGGDHMLTWGCPNRCSYCINAYYQDIYKNNGDEFRIRRYSIDRIIKELKYLKETYRLEFLKFCDENFLLAPLKYLRQFSEEYRKEIDIPFTTACDPKRITSEKIDTIKEAGCVSLSIGIESGNDRYRKQVLNRKDSTEDVLKAFSLAKKAGIRTMAFNMIGTPFYTKSIYKETIDLNRKAGVDCSTVSFFYPFKGTELRSIAITNGFYSEEMDKINPTMKIGEPSLVFENLSRNELKEMFDTFVSKVKER